MSEHRDAQSTEDSQVSEVENLGDGAALEPDDSVAGAPEAESGDAQEGEQGPEARTGQRDPKHRNDD